MPTVYLRKDLYRELIIKDVNMADYVNDAVRERLEEEGEV